MQSDSFDVTAFRSAPLGPIVGPIPERKVELPTLVGRRGRRFIPPVPMPWFDRACVLPGKALAVGMVLWYLARRAGSLTTALTQGALNQHGISRWEKYSALKALESAGLIAVHRRGRKNPEITILNPAPASTPGGQVS
jgi:hypothetical protein